MITLSNGHKMDFCVASGALGFDGRGYFWEQPFKWARILRPEEFTIITKTLTYHPREGNLKSWCPWRCVRIFNEGVVNAVGLTNPGYRHWIDKVYPTIPPNYKIIVSIAPENLYEAREMVQRLNDLDIVGIQLNPSCPNTEHDDSVDYITKLTRETSLNSVHPIILKLAYHQPFVKISIQTDSYVEAFELINSVPWKIVFNDEKSPLEKYNLVGGVSGQKIRFFAETALIRMMTNRIAYKFKAPIISCGGIYSYKDVQERQRLGAEAWSFGTVFMKYPWLPNLIARKWRNNHA